MRICFPQMTNGIASAFINKFMNAHRMNMFVMPMFSIHGVIVKEPIMLRAFLKKVIATNVWPTSCEIVSCVHGTHICYEM